MNYLALLPTAEDDGITINSGELWLVLIVLAVILAVVMIVYYARRM